MLVSSVENGWKIIYQRAHGLLAAQLAAEWKHAARPPYWAHTLVAIAEHDDGLAEAASAENLTETGAPRHFQLLEYSAEQYRNVMEIASAKSRWNALMTAMHLLFLYDAKPGIDPDLRQFLDGLKAYRRSLLRQLHVTADEAQRWYRFVEWCDAFSLLLCLDKVQPEQRRMDISTGPDGTVHQLWQDKDDCLRVEPWPFDAGRFEVEVEYRVVTQLAFPSAVAFAEAMRQAPVQAHTWTLAR